MKVQHGTKWLVCHFTLHDFKEETLSKEGDFAAFEEQHDMLVS